MKKLVIFILVLVVSMVSVGMLAGCDGKLEYKLNADSTGYIVSLSGKFFVSNVVIESEYEGKPVVEIAPDCFNGCGRLKTITIPDSIKKIGAKAFMNCDSLESVYFTGSLGQWSNISFADRSANPFFQDKEEYDLGFYVNNNLVTEAVISASKVSDFAFAGYKRLSKVTLQGAQTIGEEAFSHCLNLIEVDIKGATSVIKEYAFYFCTSLKKITIPASVQKIENYAFLWCDNLESAKFGNINSWTKGGYEIESEVLKDEYLAAQLLKNAEKYSLIKVEE